MSSIVSSILENGVFQTYLGTQDEAVYWYEDDVWVVRYMNGKLYSVWNPTNDILIKV
jgi:hypothetical protein